MVARFVLALSLCLTPLKAETISWFSDPGGTNLDSAGQPMDGAFQFQLGAFNAGFVPTASNAAQWASQWTAADTISYLAGTKLFDGQFTLEENAAPFTVNAKAYIWGRRDGTAGSEWILFRNTNWRWPTANPFNPPLINWDAKDANEVILGSVHSSGSPFLMKSAPVSSFGQWTTVALAGETQNAAGDDPDHDGFANILEFVFGTPALGGGPLPSTSVSVVEVNGQRYVQTSVPRRLDRLATLTVEVSGNLTQWNSGPGFTSVMSDDATALVVRDLLPLGPANPKRFIRFKATP